MFSPSIPELLVILLIVLVIFGANRLPQLGSDISKAIKNFKHGITEDKTEGQAEVPQKIEANATQDKPQDKPQA